MWYWNICAKISHRTWYYHSTILASSIFNMRLIIKTFLHMILHVFNIGIDMFLKIHNCIYFWIWTILLITFRAVFRSNEFDFFLFTQSTKYILTLYEFYLAFEIRIGHSSLMMRYMIMLMFYIHLLSYYIS